MTLNAEAAKYLHTEMNKDLWKDTSFGVIEKAVKGHATWKNCQVILYDSTTDGHKSIKLQYTAGIEQYDFAKNDYKANATVD